MEFDENQSVQWNKIYTEYKNARLQGLQRMPKLARAEICRRKKFYF
jgi:hypothetical protein